MKKNIASTSRDIMGGTPVFSGTRVPIATFFDYLEGDETIDTFLEDFPTVSKVQVLGLLRQLKAKAVHAAKAA